MTKGGEEDEEVEESQETVGGENWRSGEAVGAAEAMEEVGEVD